MPFATLQRIHGEAHHLYAYAMGDTTLACFGWIPWIDSQGAWQAWCQQATMSMMTATVMTVMPTTRQDGDDGNNDDGEVDSDGVNNEDNKDNVKTMKWQQGWMDDKDAMAMDNQWHAEHSQAVRATHPRQKSIYVEHLGRSRQSGDGWVGDDWVS